MVFSPFAIPFYQFNPKRENAARVYVGLSGCKWQRPSHFFFLLKKGEVLS